MCSLQMKIAEKLVETFSKYREWVRNNPKLVSDSESVLKWCSYILAGKGDIMELIALYFIKKFRICEELSSFVRVFILCSKLDNIPQ